MIKNVKLVIGTGKQEGIVSVVLCELRGSITTYTLKKMTFTNPRIQKLRIQFDYYHLLHIVSALMSNLSVKFYKTTKSYKKSHSRNATNNMMVFLFNILPSVFKGFFL